MTHKSPSSPSTPSSTTAAAARKATQPPPAASPSTAPAEKMPPLLRSVLQTGAQMAMTWGQHFRASPGMQGGIFCRGRPYCFSIGYRNTARGQDMDDRGNHMRLRDPMGYHHLSVPVSGYLAYQLHTAGMLDLEAPVTAYLPELGDRFDGVTLRRLLGGRLNMDDAKICKLLGAPIPSMWLRGQDSNTLHDAVYMPLMHKLCPRDYVEHVQALARAVEQQALPPAPPTGDATTTAKQPKNKTPAAVASEWTEERKQQAYVQSRSNIVDFFKEDSSSDGGKKIDFPRSLQNHKHMLSHFGIALAAAAIDRVTKSSFEAEMQKRIFGPLEAPSAGFGVPAVSNRVSLFYQPSGLPNGHARYSTPVLNGHPSNAAPPFFNASLNLYANPEDFAKLLVMSIEAVKQLQAASSGAEASAAKTSPYKYDLGFTVTASKQRMSLYYGRRHGALLTPFSSAAYYDMKHDAGAFVVNNCCHRRARVTAMVAAPVLGKLFVAQCGDTEWMSGIKSATDSEKEVREAMTDLKSSALDRKNDRGLFANFLKESGKKHQRH